jgi:polygalacturonase
MGSETSGGIRNVEVRDCLAEADNWAPIRFKSQPSRGGVVENVVYRNIELRGTRSAFEFDLEWNMRINVAGDTRVPPIVRNVRLVNIHGTSNAVGKIHGLTDDFVDGVTFENCDITAQRGLVIDHARNIDTVGLKLHVAEGEPITRL